MSDEDDDDRYGGYADSGKYDDDYGYDDDEEEAPQEQYQDDPAPDEDGEPDRDDDLQNLDDHIYQEVLRQQQEKQKGQAANNSLGDDIFDEYAHENLGDNFEDTPWVPPSLELVQTPSSNTHTNILGLGIPSGEALWWRKNEVA